MARRTGLPARKVGLAALALAALGFLNWHLLRTPVEITPVKPLRQLRASPTASSEPAPNGIPAPPQDLRETTARVLFNQNRRAAKRTSEEPAAASAATPTEFKLVGILQHAAGGLRVLIRAGEQSAWYGAGDTVGSFRIVAIGRERAVLEGKGERIELPLHRVP